MDHERSKRDMKTWQEAAWSSAFGPRTNLVLASKESLADDAISERGAEFARTTHSRLRQVSSRHEEILENLDGTDKEAAGTKGKHRIDDDADGGEDGTVLEEECDIPVNT